MGMITTKFDIGDQVIIKTPKLAGQVLSIVSNGYFVAYRVIYWQEGVAFFYEAYDYELATQEEIETEREYEVG